MKTILALIDFSDSSSRSTDFALSIAIKLSADLLLVNFYLAETDIPPSDKFITNRNKSATLLNGEVRRLERRMGEENTTGRLPAIRPIPFQGRPEEGIWQLARRKNCLLVIMSSSGAPGYNRSFKQRISVLIEQATSPVLIVPSAWYERKIQHVLFATDLSTEDQQLIEQLVKLFKRIHLKISICHVSRPVFIADFAEEIQVSRFIDRISNLHSNIQFYPSLGTNVLASLEKAGSDRHADVLAMRYRKHSFFYDMFHENPLKEAIEQGDLPLLIFPERGHIKVE